MIKCRLETKHFIVCPADYTIKVYYESGVCDVKIEDFEEVVKSNIDFNTKTDIEISQFLQKYPHYKVVEVKRQ